MVAFLLGLGLDPELPDDNGDTPVSLAILNDDAAVLAVFAEFPVQQGEKLLAASYAADCPKVLELIVGNADLTFSDTPDNFGYNFFQVPDLCISFLHNLRIPHIGVVLFET